MLSIGIVGLPNVGKSTLFNALTQKGVPAENFPFCTIDPSVGVVAVPDERLDLLADFSKSAKRVPPAIEFIDIAGLVKGASAGEGLGNKFLANIRETDAITEIVRIFEDPNVVHVDGKLDPLSDIEVINLELMMADLQTITKRLSNLEKDIKRHDKDAILEAEVLEKIKKIIEGGRLANSFVPANEKEEKIVLQMHLLSAKPILYVLNKKAGAVNLDETNDPRFKELIEFFKKSDSTWLIVDAGIESELSELPLGEKENYRKELGVSDDGINELIRKSYEMLGLMTYFTTGEDETRGWTIRKNSIAPVAGSAIHTDFQEKFIKADVINWQDLLDAGSLAAAREKGLIRTEGKEYIVKDGDVIEFKI